MTNSPRPYVASVILLGLLVAIAVLGSRGGVTSTEDPLPPKAEVNRIAYVIPDGQILSIKPDGSNERTISPELGTFTWPTWSPDARRLVFSGVFRDITRGPVISLYAYDDATSLASQMYTGELGIAGILAQGVLHYPMWSPDGSRVAFIAVTSQGLTLFLDDPRDDSEAQYLMDRGPLWMSWSPDSQYLLVHRGSEHFLVDTLDPVEIERLDIRSARYRVPAWRPNDQAPTFATVGRTTDVSLVAAELAGRALGAHEPIIDVSGDPAFLWSPDARFLAVAASFRVTVYQGAVILVYEELTVLPEEEGGPPIVINDDVVAYFWSPDATKLAYAVLSDTSGALRWMLLDLADGSRRPLVDFIPSRDQLTMFEFFDQYAYSHSLWSPDSRSLVFAGSLNVSAVTASAGLNARLQGSHIVVLDVDSNRSAQVIADGILGFWSPR